MQNFIYDSIDIGSLKDDVRKHCSIYQLLLMKNYRLYIHLIIH